MNKIIIPTDFSETAMNAVLYAMELFKYEKSEFLIMNAYADDVYNNTMEMDREFFEEYKEKNGKAVYNELQKVVVEMMNTSSNPLHNYEAVACFGSLVDEVNDLVDAHNASIVVMGTKGKSNKKDVTFGSQTLQVIKYVNCPVLAVPVSYHDYPLKNMLFLTDYMIPFVRRELKLVSTLASRFAAKVHFLHITDAKQISHRQIDNRTFATSCFQKELVSYTNAPGKDLTLEINKLVKDKAIDMLVMTNHRHSYLENILYRSTIEKIGLEIKIPFLVLQNLHRS